MNVSDLKDKFRQYPLAWICGGVFVLCLSLIFLRGSVVDELSTNEEDLNTRLTLIEANAANASGLDQHVEVLEEKVALIEERLFDRERRAINTDNLYSFEEIYDISFEEVSQFPDEDPVHAKGGPRELELKSAIVYAMTLRGEFAGLVEFINAIYTSDPFVRVADFEITVERGESEGLAARMRVMVLAKKSK